MNEWCFVVALATILFCLVVILLQRRKTKRIITTLNQMLESALNGSFTEHCFDESQLSAMESRLKRHLTASAVSAHNLAEEKDKIKELLADISHQTKTPLANILLYAQLLEEQDLSRRTGYVSMHCEDRRKS